MSKVIYSKALASFWCFHDQLLIYFTPFSSIFIDDFEHIIAGRKQSDWNLAKNKPKSNEAVKIFDQGVIATGSQKTKTFETCSKLPAQVPELRH